MVHRGRPPGAGGQEEPLEILEGEYSLHAWPLSGLDRDLFQVAAGDELKADADLAER